MTLYHWTICALWLVWAVWWGVAALGNKKTRKRETWGTRIGYFWPVPLSVPVFALLPPQWLLLHIMPASSIVRIFAVIVTALGLAFALWARRHLGRNWSGNVTIKVDHELIRTGPYAIVRHPIYTGLLTALVGTMLVVGDWAAVLVFLLSAAGLWRKIAHEERFMREEFGDAYEVYCAAVPALIPLAGSKS